VNTLALSVSTQISYVLQPRCAISGMTAIIIKYHPNHTNCSLCPGVMSKHRGPPTHKTSWQDWSLEIVSTNF